MPPHGTSPGKYPIQHFLPTVSFLFCEAVPFPRALHHCSLCLFFSPKYPRLSVLLLPFSLSDSVILEQSPCSLQGWSSRPVRHRSFQHWALLWVPSGWVAVYHLFSRSVHWIFRFCSWIWTSETGDGALGWGTFLALWELSGVLWRVETGEPQWAQEIEEFLWQEDVPGFVFRMKRGWNIQWIVHV